MYEELLVLLFGENIGYQLKTASTSSLKNDQWRTDQSNDVGAKFVQPRDVLNPISGEMGKIGQAIL